MLPNSNKNKHGIEKRLVRTARKVLRAKRFNEKFWKKKEKLKCNQTDDAHPGNIQEPRHIYEIVSNIISTSHYTY